MTELRLGQNEKGIETLKGGITLASQVLVEGYHHHDRWDLRGTVRASVRRSAFYLTKGVEEKENILQSTERLLAQIDDEENAQRTITHRTCDNFTSGSSRCESLSGLFFPHSWRDEENFQQPIQVR